MKLLGVITILIAVMLQISCGPTRSNYRYTPTVNNTNSSEVPSWVNNLDPHTKLVHLAENNSSSVMADFLRNNTTEFKPVYVSMALGHAVKKEDKAIMRQILAITGKNKALYATAALGKVQSKAILDFLVAQGGSVNGIEGEVDYKNTVALLAKNGPLMNLGNEYSPVSARLLVEAGADPHREIAPGHSVIKGIENLAVEFAKHDSLHKQTNNLNQIVAYLKSAEKLSETEQAVINGDLASLKLHLNKSNISQRNKRGSSLLHLAARSNQYDIAKYLVAKNPQLLSLKNNAGKTPLDLIKASKNKTAKFLSCKQNQACTNVASFEQKIRSSCSNAANINKCRAIAKKDIHGVFITKDISSLMAKSEYENACKKFNYKKCQSYVNRFSDSEYAAAAQTALDDYKNKQAEKLYQSSCGDKGSLKKCKNLHARYPGMFPPEKMSSAIAFHSQKCRLIETGWIYTGSQCQAGMAHGKGQAINSTKNLSFKGHFSRGQRVKGKVFYDSQPMFDGALSEGKPNGVGVCFYKGDPEKCEYYEGKRIDVLYKQRLAMAEQQQQMDKKLEQMQKMQQQQNAKINQLQGQVRTSRQSQSSNNSGGGIGQQIGDYALKKAGEKVMDKLFDKLF